MKAITIKQPWAWAIIAGHKPVENRSRPTKHRERIAIHASKTIDQDGVSWLAWHNHEAYSYYKAAICKDQCGAIIGVVDVIDCVTECDSPWFFGPYGYILANPRSFEPIPCRGQLGIWNLPEQVERDVLVELGA